MDRLTKEARSRNMAAIKSKNTKPELILRKALHKAGFRFRLHRKDLPGKPDIVLPKYKTVIFVHGCFWHQHKGCRRSAVPKTNKTYWKNKLEKNVKRDEINLARLKELEWKIVVIWECELEKTNHKILLNRLFIPRKFFQLSSKFPLGLKQSNFLHPQLN